MRTRSVRAGAAFVLTAGLVVGCESSPRRMPYGDNPLLQARQPLLQPQPIAGTDPQTQVAQSGPRMVVVPPPAGYQQPASVAHTTDAPAPYASPLPKYTSPAAMPTPATAPVPLPAAPVADSVVTPPMPAAPVPPPVAPPEVMPVSSQIVAPPAPPPVTQPAVRTVEGRYGHAPDHSWLQGELDRHYRGHLELRFRPASEDDPLGGKVRLEDDPRLAEFRPGDVIAIEGELLTDPDGASPPWSQYRRFHVRAARLVERK